MKFDKVKNVRYLREKLDNLIDLCRSIGMDEVADNFLVKVREICDLPKNKRLKAVENFFGTKILKEACQEYLSMYTCEADLLRYRGKV